MEIQNGHYHRTGYGKYFKILFYVLLEKTYKLLLLTDFSPTLQISLPTSELHTHTWMAQYQKYCLMSNPTSNQDGHQAKNRKKGG
jgi:hypothetical protein